MEIEILEQVVSYRQQLYSDWSCFSSLFDFL